MRDGLEKRKKGIKSGLPIGIGYIPVSFTFGFLAVSGGLPIWVAVVISLTNLTSAGQFANTNLIFAGAGYLEVALTTFVINIRYMLMSLSLSQKLERKNGHSGQAGAGLRHYRRSFCGGLSKAGNADRAVYAGADSYADSGLESGNSDGRMYFYPASTGASERHGYRSLRDVYCPDYTGGQGFRSRALHYLHSGGGTVWAELHSCVFFFSVGRLSRDSSHGGCRRSGRMAVSETNDRETEKIEKQRMRRTGSRRDSKRDRWKDERESTTREETAMELKQY